MLTLRQNITSIIESVFSEAKEELQEMAVNRIMGLVETAYKPKTEPNCSEKPNNSLDKDTNVRSKEPKTEPQTLKGGEDVHEFCKRCGESKARTIDGERYIVCKKASDMVCISMKRCPLGKWICEDTYIIVPQTERGE